MRIKRKYFISAITSMIIFIRYPVYEKILKKYKNLNQIIKLIVAYKTASKSLFSSRIPEISKGTKT